MMAAVRCQNWPTPLPPSKRRAEREAGAPLPLLRPAVAARYALLLRRKVHNGPRARRSERRDLCTSRRRCDERLASRYGLQIGDMRRKGDKRSTHTGPVATSSPEALSRAGTRGSASFTQSFASSTASSSTTRAAPAEKGKGKCKPGKNICHKLRTRALGKRQKRPYRALRLRSRVPHENAGERLRHGDYFHDGEAVG